MNYVNLAMIAVFVGIHYPVTRWYVLRTLADVDHDKRTAILSALRLRIRLLLWVWLVAVGASVAWLAIHRFSAISLTQAGGASILAFHAIWWPFAVPVIQKVHTELRRHGIERSPMPVGRVRSASLKPRAVRSYLTLWMRALPPVLAAAGTLAVAITAYQDPPSETRIWVMAVVFTASAVLFLVLWSAWVRREITMSYFVGEGGDSTDVRMLAAEELRRFRVLGIYWLQLAGSAVFFGSALIVLQVDRGTLSESAAGIFGGIAGTSIGLAGAVFGAVASFRMQRLMRRGNSEREPDGRANQSA
jgi:hypothetical protein